MTDCTITADQICNIVDIFIGRILKSSKNYELTEINKSVCKKLYLFKNNLRKSAARKNRGKYLKDNNETYNYIIEYIDFIKSFWPIIKNIDKKIYLGPIGDGHPQQDQLENKYLVCEQILRCIYEVDLEASVHTNLIYIIVSSMLPITSKQTDTFMYSDQCRNKKNIVSYSGFFSLAKNKKPEDITSNSIIVENLLKCRHQQNEKIVSKKLSLRSSYEKKAIELLENDKEIISYQYEPKSCRIPYTDTTSDNKQRTYHPDFLVTMKNGQKELIEVKPEYMIDELKNKCKFASAKMFCEKNNFIFKVWTEKELQINN